MLAAFDSVGVALAGLISAQPLVALAVCMLFSCYLFACRRGRGGRRTERQELLALPPPGAGRGDRASASVLAASAGGEPVMSSLARNVRRWSRERSWLEEPAGTLQW